MLPEATNALLCAGVLAVGAACAIAQWRGRRSAVYVLKPLTMLLVLALAVQPSQSTPASYQGLVVAALAASLAGDVFLMLPGDRFRAGLGSFLVAHLLYVAAFSREVGPSDAPLAVVPFALAGALVLAWIHPGLGRDRGPVTVYVVALVAMGWLALARWMALGQLGALLACIGAVLFLVSDAALAVDRFRRPLPAAALVVLPTYFVGQALLALSVGVGEALVDWAIR